MKNRDGFTLVELSIVLVIIGLLIGGILVAQSMISTAKIQALVRQVGQFNAAVVNFQTKYNQLPGDNNLMGTMLGDNDGVVNDTVGHNYYFHSEVGKFWADLSNSGLAKPGGGKYLEATSGSDYPDSAHTPQIKAEVTAIVLGIGSPISKKNYYFITQYTRTDFNMAQLLGAFKIADIQAIDSKIDDGIDNSGNISAQRPDVIFYNVGSGIDYLEQANTSDSCAAGGSFTVGPYDINNTTKLCAIRIRMGILTGDLK